MSVASDAAIVARWRPRLAIRRALASSAKREHDVAQASLNEARRTSADVSTLVAARDAATRKLVLRRLQVAQAERVLERHAVSGPMEVSPQGAAFIAAFEGGRSRDGWFRPYRDAVNVWTIGFGHTHNVGPNTPPLTLATAFKLLRDDLNQVYGAQTAARLRAYGFEPTQKEFDALVSFAFNLGTGVIARPTSSIAIALMRHDRGAVARAFGLYDMAGGQHLPGLTRRRAAERRLFLGGPYDAR